MLVQIIYTCEVPDKDISEQLDAMTTALDNLRKELEKTSNPCGYGIPLTFLYNGKTY